MKRVYLLAQPKEQTNQNKADSSLFTSSPARCVNALISLDLVRRFLNNHNTRLSFNSNIIRRNDFAADRNLEK